MLRLEATYECGDGLTPDVAARLTQVTEKYAAKLQLECGGKRVLLDSLIGILSLDCRRGTPLAILADGEDAQSAAEAIAAVLTAD